jgi:hypothetical protein
LLWGLSLLGVVIILGLGAVVWLFASSIEPTAAVSVVEPASPEAAERSRSLLREFRELTETEGPREPMRITASDVDGVFALAARARPNLRARSRIDSDGLHVEGSVPVPLFGGWWNVAVWVPPSDSGVRIGGLSVGSLHIPGGWLVPAVEKAVNVVFSTNLGTVMREGIGQLAVEGDAVVLDVALTAEDRRALSKGAKDRIRQARFFSDRSDIAAVLKAFRRAHEDGELSAGRSMLPHLRFAVREAKRQVEAGKDPRAAAEASVFAIAIACGHPRFQEIVGSVGIEPDSAGCLGRLLAGRDDWAKHFSLSAGLHAAGDADSAWAIGELKELLDASAGGTGFSFDDLAADRAGILFAQTLLETPPDEWPALADRLHGHESVFPSVRELPTHLSREEFRTAIREVDSAAYRELIAEIDRRIEELPFFRPRPDR